MSTIEGWCLQILKIILQVIQDVFQYGNYFHIICNVKDYLQPADLMIVESEFSKASKRDA